MRTTLLLALAIMIGISGFAQKRSAPGKIAQKPAINQMYNHLPGEVNVQPGTTNKPSAPLKSTNMIEMVPVGSSINVYSILTTGQRCLAYDPDINLLMASHRGDNVTPGFGNSNDVVAVYSTDNGTTWEESVAFLGTSALRCRYPSGVIYNPAGNTDPNNAYAVTAGPTTDGTNWVKCFYGSETKAGNNNNQVWVPTTMSELIRNGMICTSTGIAAIGETHNENDGNGYTGLFGFTEFGAFNGTTNAFDWTMQTWDPQEFVYYDATNGWYRSWSSSYQMCWSKDGSIGYKWTDGVDNRAINGSSFYPIVYKTIDGGATWEVLDYFDFGQLPEVYVHLINLAAEDRVAPWFRNSDGVVDYMGNLHIIGEVTSAVSLHPDSLTYYWTGDYGQIFDFEYHHATNQWMATWCDSLMSDDPTSGTTGNSIYGTGADKTGWDKRTHASITPDGKKVIATWTDTEDYEFWGLSEPLNMYPDLEVWVRDLETNTHTSPEMSNMTYENGAGAAWGACYFPYTAPIAIDGDGYITIPVTIADIATNGYDPTLPVFHYYLKGIDILDTDINILGSSEPAKAGVVVSALYPNPVSGVSNFNVNLEKAANVNVAVSTIAGQEISATNHGRLASGMNNLQVDASNLSSGIYFLTVTIDGQKNTQKFIVK